MSTAIAYPDAKARRDELRAAGRCINGPGAGSVGSGGVKHGSVVSGGKCQRCLDQHRGVDVNAEMRSVECPRCLAPAGERCRTEHAETMARVHPPRIAAAMATIWGSGRRAA